MLYVQPKTVDIGCTLAPLRRLEGWSGDGLQSAKRLMFENGGVKNGILRRSISIRSRSLGVRLRFSSCFAAAGDLKTAFGIEISYLCLHTDEKFRSRTKKSEPTLLVVHRPR